MTTEIEARPHWADQEGAKKPKHTPSCRNCRYYVGSYGRSRGTCQRHAPTTMGAIYGRDLPSGIDAQLAAWPEVVETDLCGEHAKAEGGQ